MARAALNPWCAVLPIGSTLAALHEAAAAHRDIKPGNILAFEGRPVISDFGLVDFPGKEPVSLPGEQIGPRLFIAPEHIGRTDEIDARPSDVYSLAKTIWVLAAAAEWPPQGHLAVGDPRLRVSSFCRHVRADLIDALLDACTKTSPEDRPTMAVFAKELADWLKLLETPPGVETSAQIFGGAKGNRPAERC